MTDAADSHHAELQRLIDRLCEDRITPSEVARLESLVRSDRSLRRHYIRYMNLNATLPSVLAKSEAAAKGDEQRTALLAQTVLCERLARIERDEKQAQEQLKNASELAERRRIQRMMLGWTDKPAIVHHYVIPRAVAYCAVAAAIALVAFVLWPRVETPVVQPVEQFVATLIDSDGARWAGVDHQPVLGDGLQAGPLELTAGSARIRFEDGAEVTLSGPGRMDLQSAATMALHRGTVSAHVPTEAVGFTVDLPGGRLIDRGTDFAITVDAARQSLVQVHKGMVDLATRDAAGGVGRAVRLTTDQSARLDGVARQVYRMMPMTIPMANTGQGLTPGRTDANWWIVQRTDQRNSQPTPAHVVDFQSFSRGGLLKWLDNDKRNSQWLSIAATPLDCYMPYGGKTTFKTELRLDDHVRLDTVIIKGRFLADDELLAIRINGEQVAGPFTIAPGQGAQPEDDALVFNVFSVFECGGPFRHGVNTLEFEVLNSNIEGDDEREGSGDEPSATGIRVELEAHASGWQDASGQNNSDVLQPISNRRTH